MSAYNLDWPEQFLDDDWDAPACPVCGSVEARWVGCLGKRRHVSCRHCGHQFSYRIDTKELQ